MGEEFENGMKYERLGRESGFHLFLGYGLVGGSIIMVFSPYWNFWNSFFLFLFGILSLLVGYSEKKELKKIKIRSKVCSRCSEIYYTSCKYGKICDSCSLPSGKKFKEELKKN